MDQILFLRQYFAGVYNRKTIEAYLFAVAEANIELGSIVKLPKVFEPAIAKVAEKQLQEA